MSRLIPSSENLKSRFFKAFQKTLISIVAVTLGFIGTGRMSLAHDNQPDHATISISGKGVASAEPDIAYISSSVVTQEKTATQALDQNTEKMQAVFAILTKAGIKRKHIQTSNFAVQPQYTYRQPRNGEKQEPPRITGYQVHNTVTVKVVNLAMTGKILSDLVKAGANQLGNITFGISNEALLLDQARAEAVSDARRKASIYLKAAGVELGPILSFTEGHASPRPVQHLRARAALAEASAVPVSGGEQELSVTVNITWEIEQ